MGSKGRVPPAHLRRPVGGPGLLHPDPYMRPSPGAFPFDVLPPPEILEQKLASQHVEIQQLARENERFAATHSSLRHELAAAQQLLHRLQNHMGAVKAEQEQELGVLQEKIAKMEADLKGSETVKADLQQAHAEAQSLVAAREELISRVQQLTRDLQRDHGQVQQIPALMSELEALKQEYHHCRATYDYERKLRNDHFESLQLMEKNYMSMVREVEKLRAELTKATNPDRSGGGQFGANAVHKEKDVLGHTSAGQNAYGEVYGAPEGRRLSGGLAEYAGGAPGPGSARAGYDASRAPAHEAPRSAHYSASGPAGYDAAQSGSYEGPGGGTVNEVLKGSGNDASRVAVGAQGAAPAGSGPAAYGSAQAPSYGVAMTPVTYGSAQQQNYGSAQQQNYGSAQQTNYGLASQTNYPTYGQQTYGSPTYRSGQSPVYESGNTATYGTGQAPAYGTGQTQAYGSGKTPNHAGGDYGAAHGGHNARR